ncbi:hypothetical protein GE061_012682 [Apolygus lucorum]|uniref:Uncharacterized protein n=1 Tax=Apolygus lucorum TaxID=248454 RepID=A0A6A4JLY1_APOLU|nr:hypothetical protein GE061_012682 [Apolygus lucorum]
MEEFLRKTECHFNWNIPAIVESNLNLVKKFGDKIEENDSLDDPLELIWPLKLTYAFELLATDRDASVQVIEDVIKEIEEAKDGLTSEYRLSYSHIAYSFKAYTLVQTQGDSAKVVELTKRIKPIAEMTQVERSALLAMKAQVLRYYGEKGTYMCVPLIRQAIQLNPEEIEFKLSLVVCMNRKRHFDRSSQNKTTWREIEEPVSILEQLLNHPKLTSHQRVSCEYFLAIAYSDFISVLKPFSPEYKECQRQILKSCDWVHDKSNHPQIISFCAEQFFYTEPNKQKGLSIIEAALKKFPFHVGVNMKASKLYRRTNNLESAVKHAQIALDGGGFGAAYPLLKLKTQLNEQFDADEYFNKLFLLFHKSYTKRIHFLACLYYMQNKYDVVKTARHMYMILIEDPYYDSLKRCISHFTKCEVSPLETVYAQIVEVLKTADHSREDLSILRRTKDKIEEFFDLTPQTDASWRKRRDIPDEAKSTAPEARGAASRSPIIRDFGKASISNSPMSSGSETRENAYTSEKGNFLQWRSEATQRASTNSRSAHNHQLTASSSRENAYTSEKGNFLQWRSEATQRASTNSRSGHNHQLTASSSRENAYTSEKGNFLQWRSEATQRASTNPRSGHNHQLTASSSRENAYTSEKGNFLQWRSEATQRASTNSRSGPNHQLTASSFSSASRTKGDLNMNRSSDGKEWLLRSSVPRPFPDKEATGSKTAHKEP